MATLHVRNVSDKLYKRIQELAGEEGRSLSAEVIQLLGEGLEAREMRRGAAAVLQRIGRQARRTELPSGWVDSVELIREDRAR